MLLKSNTGHEVPPGTHMNIFKSKYIEHNIPLKYPPVPTICEGWVRKAKGIHQVLWERGFINVKDNVRYIVDAK